MKNIALAVLLLLVIFSAIGMAKSLDFEKIKSLDLIYANKYTINHQGIPITVTYGIIEIRYKPLEDSYIFSPCTFYTFEEYRDNINNAEWLDEANPLDHFTEETFKKYYDMTVEVLAAMDNLQKNQLENGFVYLSFYLKAEAGPIVYQYIDTHGSFDYYYELGLDEEGYLKTKQIETRFVQIDNNNGKYIEDSTVDLKAVFDVNGNLDLENTEIHISGIGDLTDISSNVDILRAETQPLKSQMFHDDDIKIQRRIYEKYDSVWKDFDKFEIEEVRPLDVDINKYMKPIKVVSPEDWILEGDE